MPSRIHAGRWPERATWNWSGSCPPPPNSLRKTLISPLYVTRWVMARAAIFLSRLLLMSPNSKGRKSPGSGRFSGLRSCTAQGPASTPRAVQSGVLRPARLVWYRLSFAPRAALACLLGIWRERVLTGRPRQLGLSQETIEFFISVRHDLRPARRVHAVLWRKHRPLLSARVRGLL